MTRRKMIRTTKIQEIRTQMSSEHPLLFRESVKRFKQQRPDFIW